MNSSEEDNISEELMKLMHSSEEEGEEEGEGEGEGGGRRERGREEKAEEMERPSAPLGHLQHTGTCVYAHHVYMFFLIHRPSSQGWASKCLVLYILIFV